MDRRRRSDASVVTVLFEDKTGSSRSAIAYRNDVTEGGAGIALMTPLEVGSRVAIQGNLGESWIAVRIDADVKWCTRRTGGVYNVGLKFIASLRTEIG
jgi:hypothetical protein